MEAIMIFLAFSTYMNLKAYQMDVKSAFQNGKLKEEVYVKQRPGFESSEFFDYVCPDLAGKPVNETTYKEMIRSLKYLTATRPDIQFSTVLCTNNVVGNFNYPPNVPSYKPIMIFLLNCPLKKAFTNFPSVVYQNFLMEFWSTVVAYDPFPLIDETEQRPLREFLIKFLVLNGQRPLTLDFNTFLSSTGLDYNNGKYVAHPTPEAVLGGKYSSTEQVNSIQQLLAYCLITGTQKDLVSPLPLSINPKKGKSQTVTPTLTNSQGPKAFRAHSKKSKRHKSKMPPTETKGQRLEGNIPPADMEPIHPTVADLSWTNAKYQEIHEEAAISYADLKASIKEYYDENVAHKDKTDKLVESTMNTINKSSTTIKDIYQGLNVISQLLKDINNSIKDDPATNKKLDEAIKTFSKISTNTTEVLSLVKDFDFSTLLSIVKDL
nr:retrovirus-related Pol polyprotein from transposon TNT 1-94 [Tanacetum cinerariifolium]